MSRLERLGRGEGLSEGEGSASRAASHSAAASDDVARSGNGTDADLAGTFWALDGLSSRLPPGRAGAAMIVGDVTLPSGQHAQWQESVAVDDLLDDAWERAAEAFQALGHPVRLRFLQEVLRGRTTARELGTLEDIGTSGQIYHHLRQLVAAGWLRARPGGVHEVPAERLIPLLTTVLGARR